MIDDELRATAARLLSEAPCGVVLPAGCGKTHFVAASARAAGDRGKRVLVLTHTPESMRFDGEHEDSRYPPRRRRSPRSTAGRIAWSRHFRVCRHTCVRRKSFGQKCMRRWLV